MAFPDVIRGTNPYAFNYINSAPAPDPIPYYVGQTSITESTLMDDRYNGIWIWIDSATNITLKFPSTLLAGFNCTIIQRSTGMAFCVDQNGNPLNSESGTSNTTAQYAAIFVVHRSDGQLYAMWDGATGGGGGTDYFSTSETLTTGASPVTISSAVFLTKIISGGTGGTEIVIFADYTTNQSGKPHLIVLETQTNTSDRIQIYGNSGNSNPVLVSAFGPLANKLTPNQSPAVVPNITMVLGAVNQGFVLTWTDAAWQLVAQVGEPTITTINAFNDFWDGINNGPSTLVQMPDNTYALVPEPNNPYITTTVTASTNIGSPTLIPCVPRGVGIISPGNAGPSYVSMQGPDSDNLSSTGIQHVAYYLTQGDPSDTVVFTNLGGNGPRNGDGSAFSSVVLDFEGSQVAVHWDNTWVVDAPTNATTVPPKSIPIIGQIVEVTANHTNVTISIAPGCTILALTIQETAGHAVTGGVKIGTTSGGTDVVAAQAVGASAVIGVADAALLLKMFSTTVAQTLFIQPVSSWNSAVVSFQFLLAKMI